MKLIKSVSREQCKDTGMALCLILLLLYYYLPGTVQLLACAIISLILNMIYPLLFWPVGIFWYNFSNVLGTIMSKIILSILFLVMVVPVGFIRNVLGYNGLVTNNWKNNDLSVFTERNHKYEPENIDKPF
jgi:hypothetical protein